MNSDTTHTADSFYPDFLEPDLNSYIDAEIFREHCAFCRGKKRIHKAQTFNKLKRV